ncbi:MAG: hypothetical protein M3Q33_10270 [Acidobacteriota bacterium]|nr:hypothetical protein [Acidobacteriota bacterium]
MKHNARTYFVQRVLPSYETFVNYYNSREFGLHKDTFNAGNIAESLLDIPEQIFSEIGTMTGYENAGKFLKSISDNNRSYRIVCDLANVTKHREIDRRNPSFTSLDDMKEYIAIVRYEDILGQYYRTRKLLEVKLLDGSVCYISELLHKSLILWSNQLINLGLIPDMPKLPELLPNFAKRKDNRFDNKIRILGNVGEYGEDQFRTMIFRKGKNIITECAPGEKFGIADVNVIAEIGESPFGKKDNPSI